MGITPRDSLPIKYQVTSVDCHEAVIMFDPMTIDFFYFTQENQNDIFSTRRNFVGQVQKFYFSYEECLFHVRS